MKKLIMTLAISLGHASLKLNSLGFFQLTKQILLPLVSIVEYFFLGRILSKQKVGLLLIMTLSISIACASDVKFSWVGAAIAALETGCTSCEVVLYSWLQQSQGWETLQLLYKTMPWAAGFTTCRGDVP